MSAASSTSIARFLLPRRGAIWRNPLSNISSTSRAVRHASTKSSPDKPLILEKPAKFNPPSHGSRRRTAPRYPGPQLGEEERARMAKKKYPNMMAPEGTFMHWFLNDRSIHIWITMTALTFLAGVVFMENLKQTPFAAMLPHWSDYFLHPIRSFSSVIEVIRLDAARTTAETQERRKQKVEDVQKRSAYRKAHGLDKDQGIGGWMAKSDEETLGPGIPMGDKPDEESSGEPEQQPEQPRRRKVKKWLGIWE